MFTFIERAQGDFFPIPLPPYPALSAFPFYLYVRYHKSHCRRIDDVTSQIPIY